MAEVGLLKFASAAHEVASAALPEHRSKYSKRIFTQPQLLAVLLLMRYEDWTFREAETRLLEHSDLRGVLGLERTPSYTCLYRFMLRLDEPVLDAALTEAAARVLRPPSGGAWVAIDGRGLESSSVSTYFLKRTGASLRRSYLKLVIAADTGKLVITSQVAHEGPKSDARSLPLLVDGAQRLGKIEFVLADAEFDSHSNHSHVRSQAGAVSVIPARKGRPGHRTHGARLEMREAFPEELYGRRALVETVFSVIKRKLSARAPGRSVRTRILQALLLGLAYNIYRLRLSSAARRLHDLSA